LSDIQAQYLEHFRKNHDIISKYPYMAKEAFNKMENIRKKIGETMAKISKLEKEIADDDEMEAILIRAAAPKPPTHIPKLRMRATNTRKSARKSRKTVRNKSGLKHKAARKSVRKSARKSVRRFSNLSEMTCKRSALKKYQGRPSPPFPAQDCKGKKKKGNDGKNYVSVPFSTGVYRWSPVSSRKVIY